MGGLVLFAFFKDEVYGGACGSGYQGGNLKRAQGIEK